MGKKWSREYEELKAATLARLTREATPFADMSPAAVAARKALPFAEKIRTYFPHWIRRETPDAPFHGRMDEMAGIAGKMVVVCGARNSAKSTRIMVCRTALDLAEDRFKYLGFGGKTENAAAEKADLVNNELANNKRLLADYGEKIRPASGSDTETDWTTGLGGRLRAFGIGQSVRGALGTSGFRPQCFRCDDLDDILLNRSTEQQEKLWDWLKADVAQALDDPGGRSILTVLCNMYNRTCLAERGRQLAEDRPDLCVFERFPLLDDAGHTTWPGRFSTEQVLKMMAMAGPARARTEYLCLTANEESLFQPHWFVGYRLADLTPEQIRSMRKVLWYDPSFTETGCYKAIIVLGRFPNDPVVYCLHAWVRKAGPEEAAREIQRVFLEWPDTEVWVEDNAGTRDTYRPWFERLSHEAAVPLVRYEPATENKDIEIRRWQGEFSQGLWRFDRTEGDQQVLVNQWCDYPSRYVDGPDAGSRCRRKLGDARRGRTDTIRVGLPRPDYSALAGLVRDPQEGGPDEDALWTVGVGSNRPRLGREQFVGV